MSSALSTESNIRRTSFLLATKDGFTATETVNLLVQTNDPRFQGHHGWTHWFTYPVPDGGTVNTDYWPDTSEYSQEELFAAPGFKNKDGKQAHLFSSRHPKTVQRHFHWMAKNGVDGAFLQRFVGLCDIEKGGNDGNRRIRDEVGDRVKEAAEKEGRVYAIMYDVAGVEPGRLQQIIEADWNHLLREKRVLDSPNYLREQGKPVIGIWGLGFEHTQHTTAQLRALTSFLRRATPGGAYIMAGTPAHWRSSQMDADKNPEFVPTWMECFDAISPWTVGRYSDQRSADSFAEDRIKGDAEFIENWTREHGKRVDYVPVVHPGGSGFNMSNGNWKQNGAPREGGRFLWRQMFNARKYGARTMYGAMWDEYDEGTQFMPAITKVADLPRDESNRFKFIAYDKDGYDVPSDWYMRIAGYAGEALKGERHFDDILPEKELRDWDHSHPKFEIRRTASMDASGSDKGQGQSYDDWLKSVDQSKDLEGVPPPPYTLEAGETAGARTVATQGPETPTATRPQQPPAVPERQNSQPPPIPARLSSRPTSPATSQYSPAPAPPLPLSSRPVSLSIPASQSPALGRRPSATSHHHELASPHPSTPQASAPHPSALHPSVPPPPPPVQSSYPGQRLPSPQSPLRYSQQDFSAPSSYSQPNVPLSMPEFVPQSPVANNPWSPVSAQPSWPSQEWGYPQPSPPLHYPPVPDQSPYGYPSTYNEPISFPEAMGPGTFAAGGYGGFAMPHAAPHLEPQQLNPGPPPPLQPREYPSSRVASGARRASVLNRPPGAAARPEQHTARPRGAPASADAPVRKTSFAAPWGYPPSADAHGSERVAFPAPLTGAGLARARTERTARAGGSFSSWK
ncbi:hypothetical protein BC834DRAFT_841249 [Gloeopeniophorella convolvens]|nr:hypothetical protein BC834DRAFT_841249 [Gloeopeniophorella convolvens]